MPRRTHPAGKGSHDRAHLREQRERWIARRWLRCKRETPAQPGHEQDSRWRANGPPRFIHPEERAQPGWRERVPRARGDRTFPKHPGELARRSSLLRPLSYYDDLWWWNEVPDGRAREDRRWRSAWREELADRGDDRWLHQRGG